LKVFEIREKEALEGIIKKLPTGTRDFYAFYWLIDK